MLRFALVLSLLVAGALATDSCNAAITESIPQGMNFSVPLITSDSWISLIENTNHSISITSFYWTLTGGNPKLGGGEGQKVYDALVAAAKRGVKVRIVQSEPSSVSPDTDTENLAKAGYAEVRNLNMTKFFSSGILHSKFWVFDDSSLWLGSANMDWRSLTQVKELGVEITNCPTLATDLLKLFEANWEAAEDTSLPAAWPASLATIYNEHTPATIQLNDEEAEVFFSSSPEPFCPSGRTYDLDALVGTILGAKHTVSIEVMDYLPASAFMHPNIFWPVIDDAIRTAAFGNGVKVHFLVGNWSHSDWKMFDFLRSLQDISKTCTTGGSIEVRLFNVPADPLGDEPYTRVNHAKFIVSDEQTFISTSNFEADYYLSTGGASFICRQADFVNELQAVFDRDWNSEYTVPLGNYSPAAGSN